MPEDKRQSYVARPPLSARERHAADYITAMAAFFVIALAEQEVFEEEAIRDFEEDAIAIASGNEEPPLKPLADWRHWRRWNSEEGSLKAFMHQRIWPDLQRQYKPSDGPLGLLPELVNWSELDSNAVESAFVVATQFSNLAPIPLGHARDIFREQLGKNEASRTRDLADSFIVPPTLCELVLSLVEPHNGDKIYEPNVHRNSWLVELTERKPSFYSAEQDETAYQVLGRRLMERGPDELGNCSLHGYSENRRELLIGLVFLMFAGICKPRLHLGSPLEATDKRRPGDLRDAGSAARCL